MRRLLLALLLVCPTSAGAAITFVSGTDLVCDTTGSPTTVTLPTYAEDDIIFFIADNREDDPEPGVTTAPSGYTQLGVKEFYVASAPSIDGFAVVIYWKIASSSESNPSITWDTLTVAGNCAWVAVYRGMDTATPFDVSVAQGNSGGRQVKYTPPDVTTNTNAAMVLSFALQPDNNAFSLTVPASFTLDYTDISGTGSDHSGGVASRVVATAGTINLPEWSGGTDDWTYFSTALKPTAGGPTCTTHMTLLGVGCQ